MRGMTLGSMGTRGRRQGGRDLLFHAECEAVALRGGAGHLKGRGDEAAGGFLWDAIENVGCVLHLAPAKVHAVVRQEGQKRRGGPVFDVCDPPGDDTLEVEIAALVVCGELQVGAGDAAHGLGVHTLGRGAKVGLEDVVRLVGSAVHAGDVTILGPEARDEHGGRAHGVGRESGIGRIVRLSSHGDELIWSNREIGKSLIPTFRCLPLQPPCILFSIYGRHFSITGTETQAQWMRRDKMSVKRSRCSRRSEKTPQP